MEGELGSEGRSCDGDGVSELGLCVDKFTPLESTALVLFLAKILIELVVRGRSVKTLEHSVRAVYEGT